MDVAGALRTARRAADLSQKDLADRAGVSAGAVSRYESGSASPSLGMLDRLLEACGKDLRLTVVERIDLQGDLARLAALPLSRRTGQDEWLRPVFLERLVRAEMDVLVGGGWAADLHGIPHRGAPGRLLLSDEPESLARAARAFTSGSVPLRALDGRFCSLPVRPDTFLCEPEHAVHWAARDVGRFSTTVLARVPPWPPEQRVSTPAGPLRVVAASALTLDDDGVEADVLAAWAAWRAAAGPDTAAW